MKVEIFRKRNIFGYTDVIDDLPETVYRNVQWLEVYPNVIYGNIDGEELTIRMDKYNYRYFISADN